MTQASDEGREEDISENGSKFFIKGLGQIE